MGDRKEVREGMGDGGGNKEGMGWLLPQVSCGYRYHNGQWLDSIFRRANMYNGVILCTK